MSKSKFSITRTLRVLRFKGAGTHTYITWKVTGPKGFKKYFVTKKDAATYIKRVTDTSVTDEMVIDVFMGR